MKRMYARERTRREWPRGNLRSVWRRKNRPACLALSGNEDRLSVFYGRQMRRKPLPAEAAKKEAILRGLAKAACATLGRIDEPAHVTYEND